MRELDKTEIYDLSELNNKELQQVLDFLCTEDEQWLKITFKNFSEGLENVRLTYGDHGWMWVGQEPTANAKELFYTLEDVQVDCRELSEEQIDDMKNILTNRGYKVFDIWRNSCNSILRKSEFGCNLFSTYCLSNSFNTITYEKFMELFGYKEKSKEFKNLVEVLNEELTEEYNNLQFKQIANSLADLLEYKNNMYGNSALEPLNIFNNKTKVGQRIDDKLARIKNSTELRKNDIVDILGYLMLVCKENNWTNFDEFKD